MELEFLIIPTKAPECQCDNPTWTPSSIHPPAEYHKTVSVGSTWSSRVTQQNIPQKLDLQNVELQQNVSYLISWAICYGTIYNWNKHCFLKVYQVIFLYKLKNQYEKMLNIRETKIKTTMKYVFTLEEWPSLIHQQTSAGKVVEKKEPLCIVGGNADWYGICGKQYGISSEN